MRSGAAFSIAAESWYNQQVVNCSALNINPAFTANLVAVQPVNASQPLQYNRTLSIHNYVVVTFELITSNWTQGSSLNFSFYNQAGGKIIDSVIQTYLPNVPKGTVRPIQSHSAIPLLSTRGSASLSKCRTATAPVSRSLWWVRQATSRLLLGQ